MAYQFVKTFFTGINSLISGQPGIYVPAVDVVQKEPLRRALAPTVAALPWCRVVMLEKHIPANDLVLLVLAQHTMTALVYSCCSSGLLCLSFALIFSVAGALHRWRCWLSWVVLCAEAVVSEEAMWLIPKWGPGKMTSQCCCWRRTGAWHWVQHVVLRFVTARTTHQYCWACHSWCM